MDETIFDDGDLREICGKIERDILRLIEDASTSYNQTIKEQQKQFKERCHLTSKIAILFSNLKTKLIQHLAQKEKVLQDALNDYYSKKEEKINENFKVLQEVNDQAKRDEETIHNLETSCLDTPSNINVIDNLKQNISSGRSNLNVLEFVSVKFSPNLENLGKYFELEPVELNIAFDSYERRGIEYNIDDFLTYTPLLSTQRSPSNTDDSGVENQNDHMNHVEESVHSHSSEQDQTTQEPSTTPPENLDQLPSYSSLNFSEAQGFTVASAPPLTDAEVYGYSQNGLSGNTTYSEYFPPEAAVADIFYGYGKYVRQFKSQQSEDTQVGTPVGLAWIDYRYLMMADRFNRKLKLFTDKGLLMASAMIPDGEPYDITCIKTRRCDQYICAVAVPMAKKIIFVNCTNRIELFRRVDTQYGYNCLCHDRNGHALVCGCSAPFSPSAVHVIDQNGTILREFRFDSMDRPLFENPRSVDVTEDGIVIVCDWKMRRLVFTSTDGNLLGTYKGSPTTQLVEPIGTTLDDLGNVIITDHGSNTIHIVSIRDRRLLGTLKMDKEVYRPREINFVRASYNCAKLAIASGANVVHVIVDERPF